MSDNTSCNSGGDGGINADSGIPDWMNECYRDCERRVVQKKKKKSPANWEISYGSNEGEMDVEPMKSSKDGESTVPHTLSELETKYEMTAKESNPSLSERPQKRKRSTTDDRLDYSMKRKKNAG